MGGTFPAIPPFGAEQGNVPGVVFPDLSGLYGALPASAAVAVAKGLSDQKTEDERKLAELTTKLLSGDFAREIAEERATQFEGIRELVGQMGQPFTPTKLEDVPGDPFQGIAEGLVAAFAPTRFAPQVAGTAETLRQERHAEIVGQEQRDFEAMQRQFGTDLQLRMQEMGVATDLAKFGVDLALKGAGMVEARVARDAQLRHLGLQEDIAVFGRGDSLMDNIRQATTGGEATRAIAIYNDFAERTVDPLGNQRITPIDSVTAQLLEDEATRDQGLKRLQMTRSLGDFYLRVFSLTGKMYQQFTADQQKFLLDQREAVAQVMGIPVETLPHPGIYSRISDLTRARIDTMVGRLTDTQKRTDELVRHNRVMEGLGFGNLNARFGDLALRMQKTAFEMSQAGANPSDVILKLYEKEIAEETIKLRKVEATIEQIQTGVIDWKSFKDDDGKRLYKNKEAAVDAFMAARDRYQEVADGLAESVRDMREAVSENLSQPGVGMLPNLGFGTGGGFGGQAPGFDPFAGMPPQELALLLRQMGVPDQEIINYFAATGRLAG